MSSIHRINQDTTVALSNYKFNQISVTWLGNDRLWPDSPDTSKHVKISTHNKFSQVSTPWLGNDRFS